MAGRRRRAEIPTPGNHRMKIIAITRYGQPRDRERSKELGFESHLVKPVDLATVLHTIEDSWQRWH
jgi:CheY-like chemotaxis protein